jgi:hypothetical protein
LLDHDRCDLLGGHICEHPHAELLTMQIGMATHGLLDRPVELEGVRIPGDSGQRQPTKKRLSGGYDYLVTGVGTGERQRHHRIEMSVRAE